MQPRSWLSVLVFIFVIPASAQSLTTSDFEARNAASFYRYADPADVTVLVHVWGTVRNPGLYEVPRDTPLSHLLSLSGGPIVAQRRTREDRTIYIRVFRQEDSRRSLILESEMENEVIAGEQDLILQDSDLVTIETVVQQRLSWRDIFPVVAAVGTIAIAIERLASP